MQLFFISFSIIICLLSYGYATETKYIIISFKQEIEKEEIKEYMLNDLKELIKKNVDNNLLEKLRNNEETYKDDWVDVFTIINVFYQEYILELFKNHFLEDVPDFVIQYDMQDNFIKNLQEIILNYNSVIFNFNAKKFAMYLATFKNDKKMLVSHLFYVAELLVEKLIDIIDKTDLCNIIQVKNELKKTKMAESIQIQLLEEVRKSNVKYFLYDTKEPICILNSYSFYKRIMGYIDNVDAKYLQVHLLVDYSTYTKMVFNPNNQLLKYIDNHKSLIIQSFDQYLHRGKNLLRKVYWLLYCTKLRIFMFRYITLNISIHLFNTDFEGVDSSFDDVVFCGLLKDAEMIDKMHKKNRDYIPYFAAYIDNIGHVSIGNPFVSVIIGSFSLLCNSFN